MAKVNAVSMLSDRLEGRNQWVFYWICRDALGVGVCGEEMD